MIVLRLFAMMMAIFVLIVPPIFLSEPGHANMAGWTVTALLLGFSVAAASFLYIAMAGDRMRRRGRERMLGALLLLIPMGGGMSLLASRHDVVQLCTGGLLLALSFLLFLGLMFPSMIQRQTRMRQREHAHGSLAPLPRRV